jgi:hypothetical protein
MSKICKGEFGVCGTEEEEDFNGVANVVGFAIGRIKFDDAADVFAVDSTPTESIVIVASG